MKNYYKLAEKNLNILRNIDPQLRSFRFKILFYGLATRLASNTKNYNKLIDVCNEAIVDLSTSKNTPPQLEHFYYYKLIGLIGNQKPQRQ